MLVSLGATIFATSSLAFDIEPSKIAAGIVAGIGLSVGIGEHYIAIIRAIAVFLVLRFEKN